MNFQADDDLAYKKIILAKNEEIKHLKARINELESQLQSVRRIEQYGPQKVYAQVGDLAPAWDDCCDGGR